MADLTNINENFNKHKLLILEYIVQYYGEEYRYTIFERFKHIYFNFYSVPIEEHVYLSRNIKHFSSNSINPILKTYEDYLKVEEKYKGKYCKLIKDYLFENFGLKQEQKNNILLNEILSKEITIRQLEKMVIKLGCDKEKITTKKLEELYTYSKNIQNQYRNQMIRETMFGLQMKNDIKKRFSLEISDDILRQIAYKNQPYAGNLYAPNENTIPLGTFIRIPVAALLNRGIRSLDVCLIHEIIHKIETCGNCVGIAIQDDRKTNKIANEIRTQKIALHITKTLHENHIFILDDPKDYRIENDSKYEKLFLLTGSFLEDYEKFFNKCAMKSTPQLLELKFSKIWNFYADYLNLAYQYIRENKELNEKILNTCLNAMNDMNTFVNEFNRK